MAANMPPGFGRRPGDHDHFDYPDPAVGCEACGCSMMEPHEACVECGSSDLTPL